MRDAWNNIKLYRIKFVYNSMGIAIQLWWWAIPTKGIVLWFGPPPRLRLTSVKANKKRARDLMQRD